MRAATLSILLFVFIYNLNAQKILTSDEVVKTLSYQEYMKLALNSNLLLAAEKHKVEAADARISLAKIFPNPNITVGNASGDITGQHLQQQIFAGVTQTIPRGGKYRQGIQIARTEKELELALYEDYLRVFRLDVTKRFVNVLIARMKYDKDKKTNELLQNELKKREKEGSLDKIELYRIKIEAGQILGQMYQSEEELEMSLYDLYIPLSNYMKDTALDLKGSLLIPFRKFNVDSIIPIAAEERTDVILAKRRYRLSEEHMKLARANRRKDFELEIGNNSYTEATNYIGPTPSYQALTALITFQIPFSNLHREDLKIAELEIKQARNEEDHVQNIVKIEISQSYDRYLIAWEQLEIYNEGMLEMADQVLQQELENYKSGKTSFLDLSESHRKLDEVYHDYFGALKTFIYSKIELEDDMGIWDFEF
jgi:cobalt-zinc-cadmium efflux system outer membrane protein